MDSSTNESDREELCYLPVEEVLGRFRRRELSPPEYMEALVRRAEHVEPTIKAFTHTFFEEAMNAASAAAQRYVADPDAVRPLEGLPIAVKELSAVTGQPHTLASLALEGNVAASTDAAIQRVLDAGAIIHARTNTPEFGCASFTHNDLYGLTRNPWNLEYSPAGSSGGAAAALAAGTTPLAQGTDSAGSLRLPAAACGVVGLKASFGRVPVPPPLNQERCNHYGPMARSVRDTSILYEAMAGAHAEDLASWVHRRHEPPDGGAGTTFRRAAVINVPDGLDVDSDVQANQDQTVLALQYRGVRVEDVRLDWAYDELLEATERAFTATYAPSVAVVRDIGNGPITSYARAFLERVGARSAEDGPILNANRYIGTLTAKVMHILRNADVILLPTLCFPAPVAGQEYLDEGPTVNGRPQPDRWIVGTTVPFNLLSQLPAISVPTGRSAHGVPTGMQIVGRPFEEATVLDVAVRAVHGRELFTHELQRPPRAGG